MPHKRNPVLTEILPAWADWCAWRCPRRWRMSPPGMSATFPFLGERMIGLDATVTLDFALARLTGVIEKLTVYPDNMRANMDSLGGLIHSQRVLLALTRPA